MKRATQNFSVRFFKNRISIHALVKRATYSSVDCHSIPDISIHALVKRATTFTSAILFIRAISIHALVKRATIL